MENYKVITEYLDGGSTENFFEKYREACKSYSKYDKKEMAKKCIRNIKLVKVSEDKVTFEKSSDIKALEGGADEILNNLVDSIEKLLYVTNNKIYFNRYSYQTKKADGILHQLQNLVLEPNANIDLTACCRELITTRVQRERASSYNKAFQILTKKVDFNAVLDEIKSVQKAVSLDGVDVKELSKNTAVGTIPYTTTEERDNLMNDLSDIYSVVLDLGGSICYYNKTGSGDNSPLFDSKDVDKIESCKTSCRVQFHASKERQSLIKKFSNMFSSYSIDNSNKIINFIK